MTLATMLGLLNWEFIRSPEVPDTVPDYQTIWPVNLSQEIGMVYAMAYVAKVTTHTGLVLDVADKTLHLCESIDGIAWVASRVEAPVWQIRGLLAKIRHQPRNRHQEA